MSAYTPELGQICFGQPHEGFAMPDYAEAMFEGIYAELSRVYWNDKQESFHDSLSADYGGVHFRPYCWDEDTDAGPNFWIDGHDLRIRWYKHPGRGMSANAEMPPNEWCHWCRIVLAALREADEPDLIRAREQL